MTCFETEIIEAHVEIEYWLSERKGDLNALLARFSQAFLMISPGGSHFDYSALANLFESQGGSRPGLSITIDSLTTIQCWDNGAVLHYRETQTRPDTPVNVRWSTAVLNKDGDTITWRLLHETAQP